MREQFKAITVVPIGGVDFSPYLQLLLHEDIALVDRVVVITDGDNGAGELRRDELTTSFQKHIDDGCLSIVVGETTLEAELYGPPTNEPYLRTAFKVQHPRSLEKWDEIMPPGVGTAAERATAFSKALKSGRLDLGKGDFAQLVAELITVSAEDQQFEVPDYLKEGITKAVILPPPG